MVLVAASLVVFGRSLTNDFVDWDDNYLVAGNPAVRELSPRTIKKIFTSYDPELYVPLTLLSFQLEHAAFGLRPLPYHVDNLLLHVLNALLVFALFSRLSGRKMVAFLSALIWSVHPLNVEAVAWVSARKDLLSSTFALGSMLLYLRFLSGRSRGAYAWSVSLFLCSLLAKVHTLFLPMLLPVIAWREYRTPIRDSLMRSLPFLAFSVLFGVIAVVGKSGKATSVIEPLHWLEGLIFSLSRFVFPVRLSILYPSEAVSLLALPVIVPALILALLMAGLFLRGDRRAVVFGLLWFATFFIPSLVVSGAALPSDKQMYLPMIGLLYAFVSGGAPWIEGKRKSARGICVAGIALMVLASASRSSARGSVWRDSLSLFSEAITVYPESTKLQYNYARALMDEGRVEEGAASLRRVLEQDPDFVDAHTDLGVLLLDDGNVEEGLAHLRRAVALDPDAFVAHHNLGVYEATRGGLDAAIAEFQKAIRINPSYAPAHRNLADAYGKKGMYREALEQLRIVMELDPGRREEAMKLQMLLDAVSE